MTRHVLHLFLVAVFAIAISQPAVAADISNGAGIKLAMGPISAPMKNQHQSPQPASDLTVATPKLYHH
jgi:hypothetical protein